MGYVKGGIEYRYTCENPVALAALRKELDERHADRLKTVDISVQRWDVNGDTYTGPELIDLVPIFDRGVYAARVGYYCQIGPYKIRRVA